MRFLFLLLLISGACGVSADDSMPESSVLSIVVVAPENITKSYLELTNNIACYDYKVPKVHYLPRGTLELVLMCRALHESGVNVLFTLISAPNYSRALRMIESGVAQVAAETVWYRDIDPDKVYFTDPVIRHSEFEKGLYASADHPLFKLKPGDINIRDYRGVAIKTWLADWEVLQEITDKPYGALDLEAVYRIIENKRADYTIRQFPNSRDLKIDDGSGEMKPIPNVKVILPGHRHFIVSKKQKNSVEIFTRLNQGVKILRESGELEAYFQAMGLNSAITKTWRVLNGSSTTQQ